MCISLSGVEGERVRMYGIAERQRVRYSWGWFEIYNPIEQDRLLEAGRWHVNDAGPFAPTKFELPQITIPGRGFLVIWCE
jgi:hypothetical protein